MDPKGAIQFDNVYRSSIYTIRADGSFVSQHGKVRLEGRWTRIGATADTVSLAVTLSAGRSLEFHIQPQRNEYGEVVALILWERDGASGRRYYQPGPSPL